MDKHNYQVQYGSVMEEDEEDNGTKIWSEPNRLGSCNLSSDTNYSKHLADVLGSDEEEDKPLATKDDILVEDEAADEVMELANGRFHAGDTSIATEIGSSSISSLSLRPLRPWQFPAPKRLRSLQSDHSQLVSTTDSPSVGMSGSPSIMSDEGSGKSSWMMPYGDPAANGHDVNGQHFLNGNEEHSKIGWTNRSFLRMSRLCTLHDQEGSPTVMTVAGGILAVGTWSGKVGLFDRSKGWTGVVTLEGIVTALAISSDKTFLGVGTSLGHIYLYDLKKLSTPARHVIPVSPTAVVQGRSEGHLEGSKVLHLGFVGVRRTAIVSADEHGLSFYHSLGRILGVSSNDTLRILGKYPDHHLKDTGVGTKKSIVLAMAPLPLGSIQHASDSNNFVALLTPTKMVLVGLKPAARTWYRYMSPDEEGSSTSGCLAWMPYFKASQERLFDEKMISPTLAFSFGRHLRFIKLVTSGLGTAQQISVQGEERLGWTHSENIEGLQWLSPDFLILYADSSLSLFDVRKGKCTEEQSIIKPVTNTWSQQEGISSISFTSASFKSYKGTLFILTPKEVIASSLISWADRILALVSSGNFLGAIELVTSLLQDKGSGGGSRVGLPEAFADQKPILISRLVELMKASANYAFSEDRMKDDMADQKGGVDRTPLFEGLARVCAQASLAINDFTFLFDELFDIYSEAGIEAIFANQMESFIVSGQVKTLPIPIVQRLIAVREKQSRFDLAERIIWNVDPACLDLDQAISLCLAHKLHDALIYVYTRALHDYVGPIVELMALIKRQESDAYRIISYLSITLIGLTYPNQSKMAEQEASLAKSSLYSFLFSGRCVIWPPGAGGKLILTRDEDGEFMEPTYPYVCLFLQFDAEAFLDALDVAFEDSWLDEGELTRQDIVLNLFETLDSQQVGQIFIAIFIARNAPKYPQFIRLLPVQVEKLLALLSLVVEDREGEEEGTLEDRQFAVECLLSAYQPKQTLEMLDRFEQAGFVDVLRRVYRSQGNWDKLAKMILAGPHNEATLDHVAEVLRKARKDDRVQGIVLQSLPALVDVDVKRTVTLVLKYMSHKQSEAIRQLDRSPHRQLSYLRALLEFVGEKANKIDISTRNLFVSLVCSLEPNTLVNSLDERGVDFFDIQHVLEVTREEGVMDSLLWARDKLSETRRGLEEVDQFISERQLVFFRKASEDDSVDWREEEEVVEAKEQIQVTVHMAIRICIERAQEDLWIQILKTVIQLNHDLYQSSALGFSRTLLEDTLSSFVSSTSADQASFSTLFQKLVSYRKGSTFAEVRVISDGMMAANKLRQDLLSITNRLFDRDVHREMASLMQKQRVGWRPASSTIVCSGCGQACIGEGRQVSTRTRRLKRKIISASRSRSPSYLEPLLSPRPDKGKGVLRGEEGNKMTDDEGFFGAAAVVSFSSHSTDPIDVFSATPSPSPPEENHSLMPQSYRDQPGEDGETDSEDGEGINGQDEGIIVYNTGAIWHRRCAPI